MVSTACQANGGHCHTDKEHQENTVVTVQRQPCSSTVSKTSTSWLSCVRESLITQGITGEPLDIICRSWRQGTQKQYSCHIAAWMKFCGEKMVNPTKPLLQEILNFLTAQSKKLGYNSVASARSALSSFIMIDGKRLGEHPIISRFMTGIFNQKPAFPRYKETWNPQIVLAHLRGYPAAHELSLKQLTLKLTMLIALVSAQWTQTIHLLNLDDMSTSADRYVFKISSLLKQSKASGHHLQPIVLERYTPDGKLCVVTMLEEYLKKTASVREKPQLLLCHAKPHGPASKDTIARWIKQVMSEAGIDTKVFKAHSTRSASTSAAKAADVPIQVILEAAGWRSDSVFGKFYNKNIQEDNTYAQAILACGKH